MSDEILKVSGVGSLFNWSKSTTLNLMKDGEIPFFQYGKTIRFSKEHLMRWFIEEHSSGGKKRK